MKKLNLHEAEEKLFSLNLKIFKPNDLKIMFRTSERAVQGFLNYNVKKGAFTRLRKGFYSLVRNVPHDFVIANNLYSPSYISLDSALSYYNLIPETVYTITSITTRPTREFEVGNRAFVYHKIKKEAYSGYYPKNLDGEIAYLAFPEKAVADFLYFVYLGKRVFNNRLKLFKVSRGKLKEYLRLFGQKRLLKIYD